MERKRIEIAPACLLLLATGAIGLSALAVLTRSEVRNGVSTRHARSPERARPLAWPIDRLESLPPVRLTDLRIEESASLMDASLRVTPPAPPTLATAAVIDSMVVEPLVLASDAATPTASPSQTSRLVILLPAKPRWSAATTPVREPTAWHIFGFDTLRAATAVGERLAAVAARGEQAAGDLGDWAVVALRANGERRAEAPSETAEAPAAAPVEPVAVRGPRLLVTPVAETRSVSALVSRPTIRIPSIERYLADGIEGGLFPTPRQIGSQLARLTESDKAGGWAWAVAYRIRGVVGSQPHDSTAVRRSLAALRRAGAEASEMADAAKSERDAAELRRARYAIDRRVATWSAVLRDQTTSATLAESDNADWLLGARWAMAPNRRGVSPGRVGAGRGEAAAVRLARRLERYEAGPSGDEARAIVAETRRLAATGDEAGLELASAVEQHYRNANLRIAVATDLLRRLLPKTEPTTSVINDRIAGTPVRGKSTTASVLSVVASPDPSAWRLTLRADGTVHSNTLSRGGPAVLRSHGATKFAAEKPISVERTGFKSLPTRVTATGSSTRLVGLSTKYDGVPLFGSYARSTARREYSRSKRRASVEVRAKVERRVSQEFDGRVDAALTRLDQRYQKDVLGRLARLDLRCEPVELRTTESRLIGRLRIAGNQQLAAHTPRMRAPSDSLLSVQLHESTLNNAIEGLELAGQWMTMVQLRERLTDRLDYTPTTELSAEAARTQVRFSEDDPIRIRFAEGQAELTLAFDTMIVRGKRHRGFKVHTFYRPVANGLRAELAQVGTAQIEGRMRSSTRLRLHAAIGKVLGEDRRIPLTPTLDRLRPETAERLEGLVTTQLVIEDGWLGMAIAPERADSRVAIRVGRYVR